MITVCIAQPSPCRPSETFLRAHAERLPANISLVYFPPPASSRIRLVNGFRRRYRRTAVYRRWRSYSDTRSCMTALRDNGANVVLAEYGPIGTRVMEACSLLSLPLVVYFRGYDASQRHVLELHRDSYPRLFVLAAAIIAVSRSIQRTLIALGAPADKVYVNPSGVDCEKFRGGNPEQAAPICLAVGRFTPKKAPDVTIRAFAEIHNIFPGSRLRMIGDGPLLESCRNLASCLGIGTSVDFLGAQSHDVVRSEMSTARCFVQHSVRAPDGDCEGTPNAILEAGAAGLPVISTWHAGIPDAVIEGKTGLLTDEGDISGMARAMRRVLGDGVYARQLGQAAREHIASQFSMEQSIARLWNILNSCVHDSSANVSSWTKANNSTNAVHYRHMCDQ